MKNQNLGVYFLRNFGVDLDGIQYVATISWFVETHVDFFFFSFFFGTGNIQRRELCWHDFTKYSINIVLWMDTCEPICFKHGKMLNAT